MKITKENIKDVYRSKQCTGKTMELKGYTLIKELFVDNSGFGTENEPALTVNGFEREVLELIAEYGSLYTTITSIGMFQVYVGFFKKTGKAIGKKIALHTYEVDNDNEHYIIYHATKILEWKHDYIILNNGNWLTKTTKERINAHLPQGVYIFQKNFTWYVKDNRDNTVKDFINNMQIAN